ncbi:MAG: SH3 type 3 domain protein [Candidatus Collierbacteria bacterium GW2011_GWB1_44_197]|nr:MAG: SH3 type 3 domain protein [Candidatus Collierbacteria bacterium GW2011_GWB1_44_197]
MKLPRTWLGAILIIVILNFIIALWLFWIPRNRGESSSRGWLPFGMASFSTDFAYDARTFFPAIAGNNIAPFAIPPRILVLPHHLMASPIIAKGISLLTNPSTNTIIVLSPNHANTGKCDIISSKNKWDTPSGRVSVDEGLLNIFLKSGFVCLDDKALSVEHGIAGLLPFIKHYLPKAKIVPLALKKDISPELLTNLSELLRLSSEYLDSPASLVSVLSLIQSRGQKPNILTRTDSSAFSNNSREVTSYFLIADDGNITTPSTSTFSLLFGGDVMLGRSVNTRMIKYQDFSWPFKNISALLSSADLTTINLESPFRSGCLPTDKGLIFCSDPRSIAGLITSGVDIVNLANNHIGNQGEEGFAETISILSKAGMVSIGHGSPSIKIIKNTKLAFLGFNDIPPLIPYISSSSQENIDSQVSLAKKSADVVIVVIHWGNEYRPRSLRQVELAHLAIDSGADVVIGHHPHWVQEIETYKGKPIYYSLGNLVFDQMWSEETRKGILVRLMFSGNTLIGQEQIPIKISDYGQPQLLF